MDIKVNDYVSRKSYHNDTVFKVVSIDNDKVYLKGVYVRLHADASISDLVKEININDDFKVDMEKDSSRDDYFYLPGKILHIDGDDEYLDKCLKFYKSLGVYAIGKKIEEDKIYEQITEILQDLKPDVVVMTGHDAFYSKKGSKDDINNYKKSKLAESHKRFVNQIEQKMEEKLSRTMELNNIKTQALRELGYTEMNEDNATEIFEKIAEIESRKTAFRKMDENK